MEEAAAVIHERNSECLGQGSDHGNEGMAPVIKKG